MSAIASTSPPPSLRVPDPGRPSKGTMIQRIIRSELRSKLRSIGIKLGFITLADALPSDWAIPDSKLALAAINLAELSCPPFILRHCFRSYCFAALLAARNKHPIDRDALFVAAMLHDLGLTDEHANKPGAFEWVGADLAYHFCLDQGEQDTRAALIHNAIALHSSLGVAHLEAAEVAMLHFGTGMDLFGMRIEELPANTLDTILATYPRTSFKAEFSPCLSRQCESKPNSHIACAVDLGIIKQIKTALN